MSVVGIAFGVLGLGMLAWDYARDRAPSTVADASINRSTAGQWFDEVAEERGLTFRHVSGHDDGFYMPEIFSGGVGVLDFDFDGYLDVYFVQGGRVLGADPNTPGNQLFRNLGDGRFVDVTGQAGVGDKAYGMGCTCGDFDNDGRTDIYVTNAGANVLYRNNGNGTFTDVTEQAGVGDDGFGTSAAFVDYDRDGDLDLFVVNYLRDVMTQESNCFSPLGRRGYCGPLEIGRPHPDVLYRNNGDGTFTDVTRASGVAAVFGNGLGVVCADVDNDGWTDIVVANDMTANQLWMNQGDGTFVDRAIERGAAYSEMGAAEAGMGIDARDFDADGDLDLLMTHFEAQTNTLYVNDGGYFSDRTSALGLSDSFPFTGFGTAIVDLDNDGFMDMYVANGRVRVTLDPQVDVSRDPYAEPNLLFRGTGDLTFREVLPRGGTETQLVHTSRGAAFADLDNDGDVDILVANRDAQPYLLENRVGERNHWIVFRVVNRHGSMAIGARVEIRVGGRTLVREVRTGSSYCASNDPRVHFGLGSAARVDSVKVRWVDGSVQDFGSRGVDDIIDLARAGG